MKPSKFITEVIANVYSQVPWVVAEMTKTCLCNELKRLVADSEICVQVESVKGEPNLFLWSDKEDLTTIEFDPGETLRAWERLPGGCGVNAAWASIACQDFEKIDRFRIRLTSYTNRLVPTEINSELNQAKTSEEIEAVISRHEADLTACFSPLEEYLTCDTAVELMADVLNSKGIEYKVVCGVNDNGDSHSYIQVGDKFFDPTHQGFGT